MEKRLQSAMRKDDGLGNGARRRVLTRPLSLRASGSPNPFKLKRYRGHKLRREMRPGQHEAIFLDAVLLDIYMAEPSDARFQGRATRDDQPVPSAMAGRPSDESVIARFGSKVADRVYKPIPGASFGDPLAFASRQTATRRTENILEVLSSRPKLRSLQLSRIAIKTKGTILFIDSSDVIAIEAKGNPPAHTCCANPSRRQRRN